jgi:hypothetical protein
LERRPDSLRIHPLEEPLGYGREDMFTRRIIGFGVEPVDIDSVSVCRMFDKAKSDMGLPRYLSSDHDPPFTFPDPSQSARA